MQLFSADTSVFKKKIKKIFDPENMKKPPSKVAHNRPQIGFSVLARLIKWPKGRKCLIWDFT